MKNIFLILALTATMSNAKIQGDKFAHAFIGSAIYVGCLVVTNVMYDDTEMGWCLLAPIIAGAGKELYDSRHEGHTAEFADFAATVAIPATSLIIYKW